MTELPPQTRRMLGIMLREMEQTIMPALNSTHGSSHAQTVAHLIGSGLRNLLTREESLPELLDNWSRIEAGLIVEAGEHVSESVSDVITRNHALGETLEAIVAKRMAATAGAMPDSLCQRAIEAECYFYASHAQMIEAVAMPQRSAARRDLLAMTPERLTAYFVRKLPQYKTLQVTGVTPILSGFSKETVLVDLDADGVPMPVVIRRDIPDGAVTTTVVDEYPVVAALHRHGLPVPEPVLLETDVSAFGEAFTVTKRASGAAATNAMSGLVAGPELTAAAYALAAFLGRLHSINLADLGLPHAFYDPALTTHDYLMREIDICERYYRNHRQQPSPTIAAALTWLRANVPQVEGQPRLVPAMHR
jgi:Phosphotransferase enzyme family